MICDRFIKGPYNGFARERVLKRVLVFQIGSVGDTVVSVPAFRALKRHFGAESSLSVLQQALPGARPMPYDMLRAAGTADGFVTYRAPRGRGALGAILEARKAIREGGFSAAAYVAPGQRTAKQVERDKLFFRLAGAKELIGFRTVPEGTFAPGTKEAPHEALLRLNRLAPDGVDVDFERDSAVPLLGVLPEAHQTVEAWLTAERKRPELPLWAVCLDTAQSSKRWPMERMFEILKRANAAFEFEMVVVGGPGERELADEAIALIGQGLNAAGRFSVPESIAVLAQAKRYFGLDTGPTHLAAALGVPCVALYADMTHVGQWEPLGTGHTIIRKRQACGACHLRDCTVQGHPCMTEIGVDEVWEAVSLSLNSMKFG